MRKYKSAPLFFAAGTGTNFLKGSNFLYLFTAWNVFAFIGYNWYVKKKVKDKDKWNQMSSCKYYTLIIVLEKHGAIAAVNDTAVSAPKTLKWRLMCSTKLSDTQYNFICTSKCATFLTGQLS